MSGLSIDHGGAIAVDTEQLRDIGSQLMAVAARYDEAQAAIGRAHAVIVSDRAACPQVDTAALRRSGEQISALQGDITDACSGTLLMADAFEIVELRASAEALALTDAGAAEAVQARIDRLIAADERIGVMADWMTAGWEDSRFEGLGEQFDGGGALTPLFLAGSLLGVASGYGKVLPGMTLRGRADPVTVTPVASSTPAGAPSGVAGAFRRMPTVGGAQVAVEKYTMGDGSTRYVTYLTGTRNGSPWRAGGSEPWDMRSNTELYTGDTSASYQATLDALEAAGAQPGDRVDVVAHSQTGMVAAHLAMESEFDVSMQITAGSPVEPTLREDQTLVQLRHTDDVVSSLAGGGSAAGTGSADSFTATRVGDPDPGVHDLTLRTHGLDAYLETAEMVDASNDPRAEALDDYWAELGDAVEIERTEYRAERTG